MTPSKSNDLREGWKFYHGRNGSVIVCVKHGLEPNVMDCEDCFLLLLLSFYTTTRGYKILGPNGITETDL